MKKKKKLFSMFTEKSFFGHNSKRRLLLFGSGSLGSHVTGVDTLQISFAAVALFDFVQLLTHDDLL